MVSIIHLSDFHLGSSTGWKYNSKKWEGFWNSLKQKVNEKTTIYLVYTGDFIDADEIFKSIRDEIEENHPELGNLSLKDKKDIFELEATVWGIDNEIQKRTLIENYNDLLKQKYSESFGGAKQFFEDFLADAKNKLEIKRDHVIFCAGNHDMMRYLTQKEDYICTPEKKEITNSKDTLDWHKKEAGYYTDFCNQLEVINIDAVEIKVYDDCCFFGVDTNYPVRSKYQKERSCILCNKVEEKLLTLQSIKNQSSPKPIITLSHKPIDETCENVKRTYSEGYISLFSKLGEISEYLLEGDKHTTDLTQHSYAISGTSGRKDYMFYEIDKKKGVFRRNSWYIRHRNDEWSIEPSLELSSKSFANSKNHVKDLSFKFVLGQQPSKSDIQNKDFSDFKDRISKENIDNTSSFFCCGAHIRPRKKGYALMESDISIFDIITKEFTNNDDFIVSGYHGVGKSTLLGAVYLKLLKDFCEGRYEYLPFYYNISFEDVTESDQNGVMDSFYDNQYVKVEEFIDEVYQFSKEKRLNPLIILDGLSKYSVWEPEENKSIEKKILDHMHMQDSELCQLGLQPKHIYGIDLSANMNSVQYSTVNALFQETEDDNATGIQLDSVMVSLLGRYNNRLGKMVATYGKLYKGADYNTFSQRCKEHRVIDIDYHFLDAYEKVLFGEDDNKSCDSMIAQLEKRTRLFFSARSNRVKAEKCAYELTYNSKAYFNICKDDRLQPNYYSILIGKPDIQSFLTASYLFQCLSQSSYDIYKLNVFIDRNVMHYLRYLAKKNDDAVNLIDANILNRKKDSSFLCELNKKENAYLLCNLVYILGDCRIQRDFLYGERFSFDDEESRDYYEHAKAVSGILSAPADVKLNVCNYVEELIKDPKRRAFIRFYQRRYYGDIKNRGVETRSSLYKKTGGMDYFRCFNILSVRIEYCLSSKIRYELLIYDLFTLCDLTIDALQVKKQEDKPDKCTFFYDYSYEVRTQILECLNRLIEAYLSKDDSIGFNDHCLVYHYFLYAKACFSHAIDVINRPKESEKNADIPLLVSSSNQYRDLLQFFNVFRLGWRIKDSMEGLSNDNFQALAKDSFYGKDGVIHKISRRVADVSDRETIIDESEGIKCISAVTIAQLFLPAEKGKLSSLLTNESNGHIFNLSYEAYDKNAIISFLVFRDSGIYYTGDYTPAAKDKFKRQAGRQGCEKSCQLLLPFILKGNTSLVEVLKMINDDYHSVSSMPNINLIIAKEINVIQMKLFFYSILREKPDYFTEERVSEWEEDFEMHPTIYCHFIENELLDENIKK